MELHEYEIKELVLNTLENCSMKELADYLPRVLQYLEAGRLYTNRCRVWVLSEPDIDDGSQWLWDLLDDCREANEGGGRLEDMLHVQHITVAED